jgi:acetyl-CoA carboxylase biotin carboxylase subunit
MRRALRELVIVGLPTAQPFHLRVMDDPDFVKGDIDITYLERVGGRLLSAPPAGGLERALAVTAALLADEQRAAARPPSPPNLATVQRSAWTEAGLREGLRDGDAPRE